jgi:hypothetical protein
MVLPQQEKWGIYEHGEEYVKKKELYVQMSRSRKYVGYPLSVPM